MSGKDTSKYAQLSYLDSVNQPFCTNGFVNKLKIPIRNAVNGCRTSESGMIELIELLESTLTHIKQADRVKTRRKKKADPEKEYDLP